MRPSNRAPDEMRHVRITRNYTKHAEGSVLVEFGDTKVICTASVEDRVPGFLRGKGSVLYTNDGLGNFTIKTDSTFVGVKLPSPHDPVPTPLRREIEQRLMGYTMEMYYEKPKQW